MEGTQGIVSQTPIGEVSAPRARWINELEQRVLTSLRALKVENLDLRAEVKRLQDTLGDSQGVRENLSRKSQELETKLQKTQVQSRETTQEVQWLLKHSQEVLELRQQELQRLRSELEAANGRLQQCEGLFLRGNFQRKKVLLPRAGRPVGQPAGRIS